MVQHTHNKNHQCKFNTASAIILEKEVNWKRRRIKEAIYSMINNSINRRNDIDPLWFPIIHEKSEPIKKKIKYKQETSKERYR